MAILDASPFEDWIRAFDNHERARKRFDEANTTGNKALINYLRQEVDDAAKNLNVALRILNN